AGATEAGASEAGATEARTVDRGIIERPSALFAAIGRRGRAWPGALGPGALGPLEAAAHFLGKAVLLVAPDRLGRRLLLALPGLERLGVVAELLLAGDDQLAHPIVVEILELDLPTQHAFLLALAGQVLGGLHLVAEDHPGGVQLELEPS